MIEKIRRPINLNIRSIRFPITAIASILHRISGIVLFAAIGPMLWLLQLSLLSDEIFSKINLFFLTNHCSIRLLLWGTMTAFGYHVMAGLRQMLIDLSCLSPTLLIGKISAQVVFILSVLLSVFFGILIWYPLSQS